MKAERLFHAFFILTGIVFMNFIPAASQ